MLTLWSAQGKCCAVCGVKMLPVHKAHPRRGWTLEHVWPRSRYSYHNEGNLLVTHVECNQGKGDRDPTGCEIILLAATNAALGHELTKRQLSYADHIYGPSALAVALEQALAA